MHLTKYLINVFVSKASVFILYSFEKKQHILYDSEHFTALIDKSSREHKINSVHRFESQEIGRDHHRSKELIILWTCMQRHFSYFNL